MKVVFISHDSSRTEVDVAAGTTLMQAAVLNGVRGIAADCGGCVSCATCHVYVEKLYIAQLPEMNAQENEMLENTTSERQWNSRLSCQIELKDDLDGIIVNIPAIQH